MDKSAPQHFHDLFFSEIKITTGSVTEYYSDVSRNNISNTGDVKGPFQLPQPIEHYANDGHGKDGPARKEPNLQTMAWDTVTAVEEAGIDLKKYDNTGRADGDVDAFIIVHAGPGAEVTLNKNDLWSCKWNLSKGYREVGDSKTRVFPFLTVPEDVKLGVCAHEIGHLVFGWPDLYDVSNTSRGIGKWCLMSTGSWGRVGEGELGTTPCHPSAWCKLDQGWIDAIIDNGASAINTVSVNDVKSNAVNTFTNGIGHVHKLWTCGQASGKEYFLVENRTKSGYDSSMPGEGLLVWHIDDDEKIKYNDDKLYPHYKVALKNADGADKIQGDGDATNPFPGTLKKREFSAVTKPDSHSYAEQDTFVALKDISDAGTTMQMRILVAPQNDSAHEMSRL